MTLRGGLELLQSAAISRLPEWGRARVVTKRVWHGEGIRLLTATSTRAVNSRMLWQTARLGFLRWIAALTRRTSFLTFVHESSAIPSENSEDFKRFVKQVRCLVWSDQGPRMKQQSLSVGLETESSCALRYEERSDFRC